MLPLAALGLRWLGLRRTRALLAGPAARRCEPVDALAQAQALARIVAAAARHGPYRATCLPTALALQSMLRRRGIESSLCLGVRRRDGRVEAHAWVVHRGVALADARDVTSFSAFAPIEAPAGGQ